jgi:hypothetical protein
MKVFSSMATKPLRVSSGVHTSCNLHAAAVPPSTRQTTDTHALPWIACGGTYTCHAIVLDDAAWHPHNSQMPINRYPISMRGQLLPLDSGLQRPYLSGAELHLTHLHCVDCRLTLVHDHTTYP